MRTHFIRILSLVGSALLFAACGGGGGNTGAGSGATSTTYIGTQSPGDVWTWTLGATTFSATNVTATCTYSGAKTSLPSGFLRLTVTATTGPCLAPLPAVAYALEYPNTVLLIKPAGSGDVIAAVAQGACPSPGESYNWITIPSSTWDAAADGAYGTATSAAAAGGLFDFTVENFLLDGTAHGTPTTDTGFACASGAFTKTGSTVTIAATPSGALVGDEGPGAGGFFGMLRPSAGVDLVALASRTYRGMLFKRVAGVDTTQPVGAEPGTGADAGKLVGFGFADVEAGTREDPVNNGLLHLDSATQSAHGLIRLTLTDPDGDHQMVAVVNQIGGKFMLFGISLNSPTGTTEPYNFMLIEQ